jgi:hypothetical protein
MGSKSYSKGISWINDCRIPFVDEVILNTKQKQSKNVDSKWGAYHNRGFENEMYKPQGRFPANILVSDDMLNDGNIGQNNSKNQEWGLKDDFKVNEYLIGLKKSGISRIADKGSNSRYYNIDKWFDNLIDV